MPVKELVKVLKLKSISIRKKAPITLDAMNELKVDSVYFYKRKGHYEKDYFNIKFGLKRDVIPFFFFFVYFESNLTKVSHNTW